MGVIHLASGRKKASGQVFLEREGYLERRRPEKGDVRRKEDARKKGDVRRKEDARKKGDVRRKEDARNKEDIRKEEDI